MMIESLVSHVGWTLLHFLWQGALVGCATAVALLALRNARPESRYLVACAGLLLCPAWPTAELVLRLAGDSGAGAAIVPLGTLAAGVGVAASGGWIDTLQASLRPIVGAWPAARCCWACA
ncbi:hypothetical protein [Massilia sp. Se16.2.3]|uniref:hypothetical protein n=1 Tax=Massilia sp. Se16.2.3 TaxID=2709303 RepID=UPI001E4CD160|nr:hypothetical protein [Massilia sp. Se16.2.3]